LPKQYVGVWVLAAYEAGRTWYLAKPRWAEQPAHAFDWSAMVDGALPHRASGAFRGAGETLLERPSTTAW
jgi:hypothetical protein